MIGGPFSRPWFAEGMLAFLVVGATSAVHVVFIVVILGGLLSLAVICAMKGKWVFFVLGWLSGIFWIVGAARLAKPKSFWAKRRYGELEIAEAQRRFSRKVIPHWGGSPNRESVLPK